MANVLKRFMIPVSKLVKHLYYIYQIKEKSCNNINIRKVGKSTTEKRALIMAKTCFKRVVTGETVWMQDAASYKLLITVISFVT